MRRSTLIVLLMLPQLAGAMDFRISAGTESFNWKEYDSSGIRLLKEDGLRHFVAFDANNTIDSYWDSDFSGRLYSGTVDYDGQTQSGIKVATDTDYDGFQLEAGFRYYPVSQNRVSLNQGRGGIRMAVGVDVWRRKLNDARLSDGSVILGYTEEYTTTYGRLAAYYGGGGWYTLSAGVKYPFVTTEHVSLKDIGLPSDVTLRPQGRFSPYANIELQLSRHWGVQLYYDSYNFAESDSEMVGIYSVTQPKIKQQVIGGKVSFLF